ncbi:MAG: hypothetical protein HQL97_14145 [Magnetococcales bacterium]|nr:hypothetical protein [Magnetococcales bacterium]
MREIILGLWDGHDAGAALLIDGRLACAINEERLTRRKLEIAFPRLAIAACLKQAGIRADQIHQVAACTTDPAKTLTRLLPATKERYYQVRRHLIEPSPLDPWTQTAKRIITRWPGNAATRQLSELALRRELHHLAIPAPITWHDHHRSHAATAAFGLGLNETLVVTLDGVGDGRSGSLYRFDDGRLAPLASVAARDSLGSFFECVTRLLHLRELEDEGKVMALADHAPEIDPKDNPLLDLFAIDGLGIRANGRDIEGAVRRIHWRYPNETLAAMAQQALETWVVTWIGHALAATGLRRVALAGGIFANVRLNGMIRRLPGVERCYVFPHMGDGGLAVGAACLAATQVTLPLMEYLFVGPEAGAEAIEAALARSDLPHRRCADPVAEAARLLIGGGILGWHQGRMEYGPRALGGRSVLARPDLPGLRERLNRRLKRRAWYQPFCPAMLDGEAERLLEDHHGPPDRCMTSLYRLRPAYRGVLAEVSGAEGRCRPQMVPEEDPGRYARLLHAMRAATGLGVVLNTSFNPHGEPLVNTPEEALRALVTMGLDHLVIGDWIVDRRDE